MSNTNRYKMVLCIRTDLNMSAGKVAVQCCHGAIDAVDWLEKNCINSLDIRNSWDLQGSKKVALQIEDEKQLVDLYSKAKALKLPAQIVKDAGETEVDPGTKTVLAIGPGLEQEINKITGSLKLY